VTHLLLSSTPSSIFILLSSVCQYLVTKYGPSHFLISSNEKDYSEFLNWMHHADATLTFPQAVVLRYTLQEKGRADAAAEDYAKWYIARLRLLDNILKESPSSSGVGSGGGREYLVGGRFTIADICIAYPLFLGQSLQLDGKALSTYYQPQTMAYLERMTARPAFLRAIQIQKESLKRFKEQYPATPAPATPAPAPPSPRP
jgi:glutathione S-transferase